MSQKHNEHLEKSKKVLMLDPKMNHLPYSGHNTRIFPKILKQSYLPTFYGLKLSTISEKSNEQKSLLKEFTEMFESVDSEPEKSTFALLVIRQFFLFIEP